MTIAFFLMALIILSSAIGVVAFRNPINSALCLIANLLTVAAVFAALDAHFLAAVQIIVYAGAIVVLVLFVLMLLNIKVEAPSRRNTVFTIVSVVAGITLLAVTVPLINDAFSKFPVAAGKIEGTVENIGMSLYTTYVFTFEAASVLIMAAIAGAVMLAKKRYRR